MAALPGAWAVRDELGIHQGTVIPGVDSVETASEGRTEGAAKV